MADPIPFTDPEPQFGPEPPFVREARLRRAAGMDKSVAEAQQDALAAALANLLGQAGGMASYLPVGERNQNALRDFARFSSQRMGETSEALSEAAANEDLGVLGEAAVRLPVSALAVLPEMYNPVKKLHVIKKIPGVPQYGADVLNAAWHGLRGNASDGPVGGVVAAGSNIAGERLVEPAIGVAGRALGIPYDLAGNAAGSVIENFINEIRRLNEQ
jgi:hypothetical protein